MSPDHGIPDVGEGSTLGNILGGAALGTGVLGALGTLGTVPGAGSTVTGNYNPADYVGINPDTGLYDPNYDPSVTPIPGEALAGTGMTDWSGLGQTGQIDLSAYTPDAGDYTGGY
jgi:hypothetical protein